MSSWIGSAGQMWPLVCGSRLSRSGGMPAMSTRTFASGRTQTTLGPLMPRVWTVDRDVTTPQDRTVLSFFAAGAAMTDPVAFYSDEATVGNILLPEDSMMMDWQRPGSLSGPWGGSAPGGVMQDGTLVPRVYTTSITSPTLTSRYPVPSGATVTAAAYVSGTSARIGIRWWDSGGAQVGVAQPSPYGTGSGSRVSVTATAPTTAVAFDLVASNAAGSSFGLLTATLTPDLRDAQEGMGCLAARVTERTVDVLTAWQTAGPSSALASVQFQIREERP